MLTIAYCTSRKEPKIEWFFDSLRNEILRMWPEIIYYPEKNQTGIRVVVVDRFDDERNLLDKAGYSDSTKSGLGFYAAAMKQVPVKPNVWQGKHRLTKEDWFAAANARNTALCLAPDGYIAYADDLSVLLPGWLDRVKAAMDGNYIVCGTYQKVKDLVVENGEVKSFTDYPQGHDNGRKPFALSPLSPCVGGWLFGCSCAMPVEALLTIGGWPEFCDGLGFEDCVCGVALTNAGFKLFYDQKMMTYESEELHHVEPSLKKTDKGISPDDKSHRAINIVQGGTKFFDNYVQGGMRTLREKILKGEPWPTNVSPAHDWYDGQPIQDMKVQ